MGAFVFDPIPGFYRYPVITLDFNSLYPTTMITYNISPETLVYGNVTDDVSIVNVITDNTTSNEPMIDFINGTVERQIKFYKGMQGIFPSILENLLSERKKVKKMMIRTDPLTYKLLDAKQKSLKVVANSLYGLLGA